MPSRSPAWPVLKEQETKDRRSITHRIQAAIDPGCVKTQKGRLRRGIAFYWRREFRVVLLPVARTLRGRGRSFYAFLALRRFRTAKTQTRHRAPRHFAMQ